MTTAKRKPVKTEADANRFIRAGVRRILTEQADEWRPLWVRGGEAGTWRIEREYGGKPELVIDLQAIPLAAQPIVQTLLDLLGEQAWCARLAGILAQGELAAAARRDTGGSKTARDRKAEGVERDERLGKAARALLKANPRLSTSDVARTLSLRGMGGFDAIRRRLPGILAR